VTITIRGGAPSVFANNGSSPTIGGAVALQSGDVAVFAHGNDFYTASAMNTPTVDDGAGHTPTVVAWPGGSADAGTNLAHINVYYAKIAVSGTYTISVTESAPGDEDKCMVVYPLIGVDQTTPNDGNGAGASGSGTSEAAPSVSPSNSDSLLIVFDNSGGGASAPAYTSPSSPFVEQYEIHTGGISGVGGTEQLSASGATGTRTFTTSGSIPWAAVTIAVRAASTATPEPPHPLISPYSGLF